MDLFVQLVEALAWASRKVAILWNMTLCPPCRTAGTRVATPTTKNSVQILYKIQVLDSLK
jgi:hypothetical protein